MGPNERSGTFTLTVTGQRYERWEEINVTREIDGCAGTSTSPYSNGSWQGRLVLTRAGNDRADDALLQGLGGDVQWASAVITGSSPVTSLRRAAVQPLQGQGATDGAWRPRPRRRAGRTLHRRIGPQSGPMARQGDAVAGDAQPGADRGRRRGARAARNRLRHQGGYAGRDRPSPVSLTLKVRNTNLKFR